jgi:hypothetical protein
MRPLLIRIRAMVCGRTEQYSDISFDPAGDPIVVAEKKGKGK